MLKVGFTPAQQNFRTNKQAQSNQNPAFGTNIGPRIIKTMVAIEKDMQKNSQNTSDLMVDLRNRYEKYQNIVKSAKGDNNPGLTVDIVDKTNCNNPEVVVTHKDFPGIAIEYAAPTNDHKK
ncbi:MAG: hypothetical protein ACD_20C00064G0001, partial [uncultured bacterium]